MNAEALLHVSVCLLLCVVPLVVTGAGITSSDQDRFDPIMGSKDPWALLSLPCYISQPLAHCSGGSCGMGQNV